VIGGLPIGRHNTNGLALAPDGMLYVVNGNSTDSGFRSEGGPPEQPPYSGSLLRVDPLATDLTPQPAMVMATGWRNIFDLAFVPAGHPVLPAGWVAIAENGPDGQSYEQPDGSVKQRPAGEDTLALVDVGNGVVEHFGFPWCLYDRDQGGLQGFTQDPDEGQCAPLPAAAAQGVPGGVVRAHPVALFGLHVSANGLDFNPGGNFPEDFDGDLFVAQFGNFFGEESAGRKIVRVRFGAGGAVQAVEDFLSGSAPLGLEFGPDGAMWVADFGGQILRVAALP
jgi:glucose/arabinose dehydrogenase